MVFNSTHPLHQGISASAADPLYFLVMIANEKIVFILPRFFTETVSFGWKMKGERQTLLAGKLCANLYSVA